MRKLSATPSFLGGGGGGGRRGNSYVEKNSNELALVAVRQGEMEYVYIYIYVTLVCHGSIYEGIGLVTDLP